MIVPGHGRMTRRPRRSLAIALTALLTSPGAGRAAARTSPTPDEAEEPGRHLAQQAVDVEILRTTEGLPTLLLQAEESRTWSDGELNLSQVTLRLFDAEGRETLVRAPRAISDLTVQEEPVDPRVPQARREARTPGMGLEGLESWRLEGGVSLSRADDLQLDTESLSYLEGRGEARTTKPISFSRGKATGSAVGMRYDVRGQRLTMNRDVKASMTAGAMGRVAVDAGAGAYDLGRNSFEMTSYRATTERGEILTGARLVVRFHEEGGIKRLEGEGGFVLETTHAEPQDQNTSPLSRLLALEGTRTMEGQRIAVNFGPDAKPRSIEVSGVANLTAREEGDPGSPARIAAQNLVFDLVNGSLQRARATGNVDLTGAARDGESTGFQLLSEVLTAAVDPNSGSIVRLEGEGEIQLTDEGMESHGSATSLDPNTDIITLAGEEGLPARAIWLGRKIQADRIEANRRLKTVSARGNVRTSYRPSAEETDGSDRTLPFFRNGETIHAMAGALTFADRGQIAHYSDRVRIWQGENRLEGGAVDLLEAEGRIEASDDVVSTFRQAPSAVARSAAGPSADIVTVAAGTMRYQRSDGRVTYGGGVLLTQGAMRVTSDALSVVLEEGGGGADSLQAEGRVEFREPGRVGRGDRLFVDFGPDTIRLTGSSREATVQDEAGQQVVRGQSLTMERASDRILVESELGGRTWILLKARQKGAPSVGSDPED